MTDTRIPMNPLEIRRFMYAGKASLTMHSTRTGKTLMYKILAFEKNPNMWKVMINVGKTRIKWCYLSCINGNRPDRLTNAASTFKPSDIQWIMFEELLRHVHTMFRENIPNVYVTHNGFCGRCGKHLHDDESVKNGFGPACWKKIDSYGSPYNRKEVTR